MKIKKKNLKKILELAFEGGNIYGSTNALFWNTDSVSRHTYDNVADINEVVGDIMLELKNNKVKK